MTTTDDRSNDEAGRLDALRRYDILDTPAEPKFDRIVRMAVRHLGVPIAAVCLVDETRAWLKAKTGIDVDEAPRSLTICTHTIQGDGVMVVEDARLDPRFADHPYVNSDPPIRFYAGAPLTTSDGYNLGTLCVLDRVPREFTQAQRTLLEDLAALVVDEMELRRANKKLTQLAATDAMTGLWNRRRFFTLAEAERQRSRRYGRPLSLLVLDIDHFKAINDRCGHSGGDQVIIHIARICENLKRTCDIAARLGGEEFAILLPETGLKGASGFAERLRVAIANEEVGCGGATVSATVSIGVSRTNRFMTFDDLLKNADRALYKAKRAGRNRVCSAEDLRGAAAAGELTPALQT